MVDGEKQFFPRLQQFIIRRSFRIDKNNEYNNININNKKKKNIRKLKKKKFLLHTII